MSIDLTQEFIDWLDGELALIEWNQIVPEEQVEVAVWARAVHREEHRTGRLASGVYACCIHIGPPVPEERMQEMDRQRFWAARERVAG